jgi:hypothetical protein
MKLKEFWIKRRNRDPVSPCPDENQDQGLTNDSLAQRTSKRKAGCSLCFFVFRSEGFTQSEALTTLFNPGFFCD